MKVYLAGNVTVPRERVLLRFKSNRLFSFYYHGTDGEFEEEYKYRIGEMKGENILRRISRRGQF